VSTAEDSQEAPAGAGFESEPWLAACRRMVAGQRLLFEQSVTTAERNHYEGQGEGGDWTLRLDRQCEDLVFTELEGLAADGLAFTAISEERGTVEFNGGAGLWVVIDPIDGSLNVRRTLPHHSLSIAVAAGPDMSQVEFGYVFDFGPGEEFHATAGRGAFLGDRRLSLESDGDRGRMELVGVEGAEPSRLEPWLEGLKGEVYRLRCVGSLAITVAWLATGRLDGMFSAHTSRSVDVAAAQLIAREAGALVELGDGGLDRIGFPLDTRFTVLGAADQAWLETLRAARPEPA
jgi:myo-inositol-1(or 4)-monophosphatase